MSTSILAVPSVASAEDATANCVEQAPGQGDEFWFTQGPFSAPQQTVQSGTVTAIRDGRNHLLSLSNVKVCGADPTTCATDGTLLNLISGTYHAKDAG